MIFGNCCAFVVIFGAVHRARVRRQQRNSIKDMKDGWL
jgi:hypothetical protein